MAGGPRCWLLGSGVPGSQGAALLITGERIGFLQHWAKEKPRLPGLFFRADDGDRTRDPQLGKLMLYQLSYVREAGSV